LTVKALELARVLRKPALRLLNHSDREVQYLSKIRSFELQSKNLRAFRVQAVQVNFAMLCCRDAIQYNRTRLLLQRAIKDLRVQNGYVPKLQKLEQPEELNLIQVTLEKFEKSLITARAASLSLFGQGGVL
jgi:hypothetical protein